MEDVIFKDQIWSFSSTPHAVHHFSLATACHIGIRIAKRVANWKSWQPFVLWWFGHTVSSSDGFLSSTRLLDSTLLSLGISEVHWPESPRFLIRFLFPTPHFLSFITVCGCVWGGMFSVIEQLALEMINRIWGTLKVHFKCLPYSFLFRFLYTGLHSVELLQ